MQGIVELRNIDLTMLEELSSMTYKLVSARFLEQTLHNMRNNCISSIYQYSQRIT